MTVGTAGSQVAARDQRIEKSQRYVPLASLAISLLLALSTGSVGNGVRLSRAQFTVTALVLSAVAASWVSLVRVPYARRETRKTRAIVYFCGVIVLLALLVRINPWFAFFGATGYVNSIVLPRRLMVAGLTATAALVALAQLGGGIPHGTVILGYCGVVLANLALVGYFQHQGLREMDSDEKRMRLLDELAEANSRLENALQENAGLHAQLVAQAHEAGTLDERRRMAGEIHDTLAQGLTGIITQLEAADVARGESDRRRHLDLARELARSSLTEARRSVQALRPGPLDEVRLPDALAQLAQDWQRASTIPVRVEIAGTPVALQPALEVVLYRAAQEGLANVAKHSGAAHAGLTLTYTPDVVVLDVLDDGSGFDASAGTASRESESTSTGTSPGSGTGIGTGTGTGTGTGYGLEAMRSRLRQVGGALAIESTLGEGTTLSASVPVRTGDDQR